MRVGTTVYCLGDNVATDLIHPPPYFSLDVERMKKGFLRGISDDWAETVPPGAIILAGDNLGCGSSREVTAQVFRERGIRLVLARSFARIFFRNLINLGVLACRVETPSPWPVGSEVEAEFDPDNWQLRAQEHIIKIVPPSSFVARIVAAGGVIPLLDDLFEGDAA